MFSYFEQAQSIWFASSINIAYFYGLNINFDKNYIHKDKLLKLK